MPESEETAAESHRVALENLPTVISSRPIDLVDVGPSVARQILRMEDKYATPGFREAVMNSLRQLVVEDPDAVGNTLVEEIFREGSLQDRQNALWALTDAAFELSNLTHLRHLKKSGPPGYVTNADWLIS